MGQGDLVRFGSHTRHHLRLTEDIPAAEVEAEVAGSQQDLEARLGRPARLFCYPNGDHPRTTVDVVRKHYMGAVTTTRGWNTMNSDPAELNRIGLHQDITADRVAFLARLSGWL